MLGYAGACVCCSNVALCVNPELKYVKVKNPENGKVYIVAESRLSALPGAVASAGTSWDYN